MSNSSILSAFERMWQHISSELSTKAEATHDHGVFALPLIVGHTGKVVGYGFTHTADEIIEAVEAGRHVYVQNKDGSIYSYVSHKTYDTGARGVTFFRPEQGGQYEHRLELYITHDNVSTSTYAFGKAADTVPAYTEADYGKMLTPTADGLVWTDPPEGGSGDTIPAAEGVEF